ncbi:MAG: DUF177 domain-containing protein [Neisseriaceae bacterium]|nr:DUF177 domain-containing protein [Neisseriaceae bacterium]
MLNINLIDPKAFAQSAQSVEEEVPVAQLDERVSKHEFIVNHDGVCSFSLKGGVDKWQRAYLDLTVQAHFSLTCQRCMQPTAFVLDESARIVLFDDEASLDEAMLQDPDLDGILYEPELNVYSLVEDQIIMALPFSPMHDDCDNEQLAKVNRDKPNPFAVLAGLRKSQ